MASSTSATIKSLLTRLKSNGTAQNRKIYGKHGVAEPLFGVSYAHQKAMAKKSGVQHDVALGLWKSGNHDARILATMIADPDQVTGGHVDAWVKDLKNYVLTDALVGFVGKTKFAKTRGTKWRTSKIEWRCAAGWGVLGQCADRPKGDIAYCTDEELCGFIDEVEAGIHTGENRVRHAMNMALIAFGSRSTAMERYATKSAKRIGKVDVDHGPTSCKTPDAVSYIKRVRTHRKKKASKKQAAKRKKTTNRKAGKKKAKARKK